MNDEIHDLGKQVKLKFNHFVTTGHDYDWDDHNSSKSIYQKALTLAKNQYFTTALTKTKPIWKYICQWWF